MVAVTVKFVLDRDTTLSDEEREDIREAIDGVVSEPMEDFHILVEGGSKEDMDEKKEELSDTEIEHRIEDLVETQASPGNYRSLSLKWTRDKDNEEHQETVLYSLEDPSGSFIVDVRFYLETEDYTSFRKIEVTSENGTINVLDSDEFEEPEEAFQYAETHIKTFLAICMQAVSADTLIRNGDTVTVVG